MRLRLSSIAPRRVYVFVLKTYLALFYKCGKQDLNLHDLAAWALNLTPSANSAIPAEAVSIQFIFPGGGVEGGEFGLEFRDPRAIYPGGISYS